MTTIQCPNCGERFNLDASELSAIVAQIRTQEFDDEVEKRVERELATIQKKHDAEIKSQMAAVQLEMRDEISKLLSQLQEEQARTQAMQAKLDAADSATELAVLKATSSVEKTMAERVSELERQMSEQKPEYESELRDRQTQLDYYKDLKTRMSTKMVGETLEQHCLIEFNKLRATAFRNAYFEKDNDARSGSKGDFIYRECDEDGNEIISIMFEMKNGATCSTTNLYGEKVAA